MPCERIGSDYIEHCPGEVSISVMIPRKHATVKIEAYSVMIHSNHAMVSYSGMIHS